MSSSSPKTIGIKLGQIITERRHLPPPGARPPRSTPASWAPPREALFPIWAMARANRHRPGRHPLGSCADERRIGRPRVHHPVADLTGTPLCNAADGPDVQPPGPGACGQGGAGQPNCAHRPQ